MNPRRFNDRQRVALYLAAGGHCSNCGVQLEPGWHADHITPYSRDGQTDVVNGQALCPTCNLRKGAQMRRSIGPWPNHIKLRQWQESAFWAFVQFDKPDFLVDATPGAGKTTFLKKVVHDLFLRGAVSRVIVVVPSDTLREQWADELAEVGIQVDPVFINGDGRETRDYHGIVVTYASVTRAPDLYRMLCAETPTAVVFDEIHHASKERAWGKGLRHAFEPARYRVAGTGTPFRSDGHPIPFVEYVPDRDGELTSRADYKYQYRDALADGVVRPVMFQTYEGKLEWISDSGLVRASFQDEISEKEATNRLRAALFGPWLEDVLRAADEKLTDIRKQGHVDAGALVSCVSIAHAKRVAKLLHKITGEQPLIVTSQEDDPRNTLRVFRAGVQRWLVAVRMVSEGVDIPRLRVGVYATNIITEMWFRQFAGRFVRVTGEEQTAWILLPSELTLMSYALRFADEAKAALKDIEEQARQQRLDGLDDEAIEHTSRDDIFRPGAGEALPDRTIFDGDHVDTQEWNALTSRALSYGITDPRAVAGFAQMARDAGISIERLLGFPDGAVMIAAPPQAPLFREREDLRERRTAEVRNLAGLLMPAAPLWGSIGELIRIINGKVAQAVGSYARDATVDQMRESIDLIQTWQQEFLRAREVGNEADWVGNWFNGTPSQRRNRGGIAESNGQYAVWPQ